MNENNHCKKQQSDDSHYADHNCAVCKFKMQAAICGYCGHSALSHTEEGPCCWDEECGCKKYVESESETNSVPIAHLREKIDAILAVDVYDTLDKIAHLGCNVAGVLGGKPCGKCGPCIAKPVWQRMHNRSIRAGWGGVYARVTSLIEKLGSNPRTKVRNVKNLQTVIGDLERMLGLLQ